MKLSLIQMRVADDKQKNLLHAAELIRSCRGADVVMLPEMFCCPYGAEHFKRNAEPEGGPVTKTLSALARENGIYLIGGSMPEADEGRIFNTCFVYDPEGNRTAKHRKAHMFDIDIAGGQRFMESETLSAGAGTTVFDTPFGRFGLCICFDVRFAEFVYSMRGIDFLAVPAAFNMTTGPLHWELLFRARAMDCQAFAFGCAPARDETAPYVSYGNSIAVSPWGKVIARADENEAVLTVEADRGEALSVRAQIPIGR